MDAENVRITGGEAGVWYGCQTLQQMVEQCGAVLPFVKIEDGPDIPNRGFYHDVTRGRVPKLSFLKKMADRMAYYKRTSCSCILSIRSASWDFSEIWRDDTPLTAGKKLWNWIEQLSGERNRTGSSCLLRSSVQGVKLQGVLSFM